jgi:hypothetical protein
MYILLLALEFDPMMPIDAMWWRQMCGEGTLLSVEWLWLLAPLLVRSKSTNQEHQGLVMISP